MWLGEHNNISFLIDCLAAQESRHTVPCQAIVEKLATENKNENKNKNKNNKNINNLTKLLKSKKSYIIGSLNTQTLHKLWKIPELIDSAKIAGHEVICIQ